MLIRPERPEDIGQIDNLTAAAFAPMPFSDGSEPAIIRALRRDGMLTLSLVAAADDRILGHAAFSPVTVGEVSQRWYGLGPIAVAPGHQRQGIGTALMTTGLQHLRTIGALGCALIGDPAYYSRHGFISEGHLHYPGVPDTVVQHMTFSGPRPRGTLIYTPAFAAKD
ncbi:MAG: N-acetyltransferase [Rhodobacterales bacterium]|nr:N-acetyltransferase [Rhodobacterales bacterium]